MADNKITFTGDAGQLVGEYQKVSKAVEQQEQKLRELKRESKEVAKTQRQQAREAKKDYDSTRTPLEKLNIEQKRLRESLQRGSIDQETFNRKMAQARNQYRDATQTVRNYDKVFTGAMTAGVAAIALINKEFTAFHDRLKEIKKANIDVAGSMQKLRLNFSEDATLSADNLDDKVREIALATGQSIDVVASVLGPAFSAKGSQSNAFAADATLQALMVTRDPEEAQGLTGAIGDLAKLGETENTKAILNGLIETQKNVRLLTVNALAKAGTPAANASVQAGGSIEEGFELFGTIANLSADKTGEQSATAVVNFLKRLDKFQVEVDGEKVNPLADFGSPSQKIAHLQQNPELAKQFFEQFNFEAKIEPALKSLVFATDAAMTEFRSVQGGVPSFFKNNEQQQAAAFDEKLPKIQGRDTIAGQLAFAQNRAAANRENFQVGSVDAAISEGTREVVFQTVDALPISEIRRKVLKGTFDTIVEANQIAGGDRNRASAEVARTILSEAKSVVPDASDRFIDEQLKLLGQLNSEVTKLRIQNERAAKEAEAQRKQQLDGNKGIEQALKNQPRPNPANQLHNNRGR